MGRIEWLPIGEIPIELRMSGKDVLIWQDGEPAIAHWSDTEPTVGLWEDDEGFTYDPSHFAEINPPD